MKITVKKSDFNSCIKSMRTAKSVGKKIFSSADVQLIADEKLTVSAPGFLLQLDCKSDEWGCVIIPSAVWYNFLKVAKLPTNTDEIILPKVG